MYPYFRWMTMAAGALAEPKQHVLDAHRRSFRVMPGDVEVTRMNNGRYLTLMDLGRVYMILRSGMLPALVKHKWIPIVGGVQVRFRRSLVIGQRFDLVTRVAAFDDKYWYIDQRFEVGGEVYAGAYVRALVRAQHKSSLSTREVLDATGYADVVSPPMPDAIAAWIGSEGALRADLGQKESGAQPSSRAAS